eukprot:TRINITY_DN10290_c0_g1_i8.p1 TRINITY_DN10290_c0_g1~~TRINITY_DN10290_c0_g1_i8.p1  ORF type:complete len:329 (-),score=53.96 TRINITY_DN10290_c0_g1_i8:143-1129(-)
MLSIKALMSVDKMVSATNNPVLVADSSNRKASRHIVSYYKSALLKSRLAENVAKEESECRAGKEAHKLQVVVRNIKQCPVVTKQLSRNLQMNFNNATEESKDTVEESMKDKLLSILRRHKPLRVHTTMGIAKYKRLDRGMLMLPEVNAKINSKTDPKAEWLREYIQNIPKRFMSLVEQKLLGNPKVVCKEGRRRMKSSFSVSKHHGAYTNSAVVIPTLNNIRRQYKKTMFEKNLVKIDCQYRNGRLITALRTDSMPRQLPKAAKVEKKEKRLKSIDSLSPNKLDLNVSDATVSKCEEMRKMFEKLTATITSVDEKGEQIVRKMNELYK